MTNIVHQDYLSILLWFRIYFLAALECYIGLSVEGRGGSEARWWSMVIGITSPTENTPLGVE